MGEGKIVGKVSVCSSHRLGVRWLEPPSAAEPQQPLRCSCAPLPHHRLITREQPAQQLDASQTEQQLARPHARVGRGVGRLGLNGWRGAWGG